MVNTIRDLPLVPVCEVQGLRVGLRLGRDQVHWLLRDVDLTVKPGEIVGLVGPSGAGKSTFCRALLGILPPAMTTEGRIRWLRGAVASIGNTPSPGMVGYVPQNPITALHPLLTVRRLFRDLLTGEEQGCESPQIQTRAVELLNRAGLTDAERVLSSLPQTLSGGMRQRVLLALALARRPPILVLDEPTASNDAITVGELGALLRDVRSEGTAILLVSHDLALLSEVADRFVFLSGGRVETEEVPEVLASLQPGSSPAVRKFVSTYWELRPRPEPGVTSRFQRPSAGAGAEIVWENVGRAYNGVMALDRIDLTIRAGQRVALVGPSGAGKTTLARLALGLESPSSGAVRVGGAIVPLLGHPRHSTSLHTTQFIPQNAGRSLNPARTVNEAVGEPLVNLGLSRSNCSRRIKEVLGQLDLPHDVAERYPTELSEGQRQRVCIARALTARCRILIADECFAGLDASTAKEVARAFDAAYEATGITLVFILHDLGLVTRLAERVVFVAGGRVVEDVAVGMMARSTHHPTVRDLLKAAAWSCAGDLQCCGGVQP